MMYDDHPSLVLSRAYIALKQSREELKGKDLRDRGSSLLLRSVENNDNVRDL